MIKIKTYIISIAVLLISNLGFAQGWAWARQSTGGAGAESSCVATDASGNVYCTAEGELLGVAGYHITLGTYTIPFAPGQENMIAKYDPLGNLLWAEGTDAGVDAITVDPSGNLVTVGGDALTKIGPSGTVLWSLSVTPGGYLTIIFGTAFRRLARQSVTTDAAGNIYVTGAFSGRSVTIGTFTLTNADPTGATEDIYVAKYTPAGAVVWATSIGGPADEYVTDIAVANTGFVYVVGAFESPGIIVGSSVISNPYTNPLSLVAKFSAASGAPLWAEGDGAAGGAYAAAVACDNSGNIYVTGGFYDYSISFGSYSLGRTWPPVTWAVGTTYLVQFSPAGVVAWGKIAEAATTTVTGYGIALAPCNRVWICGSYGRDAVVDAGDTLRLVSGAGPDPAFIIGYQIGGSAFDYKGIPSGAEEQNVIASDPSGNILFTNDLMSWSGFPSMIIGSDTLRGDSPYNSEYLTLLKYAAAHDSAFAHSDTALCTGTQDGLTLKAPAGYASWQWDNGATDSTRTVTASGAYYVICSACGSVLIDSFYVALGNGDTTGSSDNSYLCGPEIPDTLHGPPAYTSYVWSSGQTTSSIPVTAAGHYFVTAISGCNLVTDTFEVAGVPAPVVTLAGDTIFCAGQSVILSSPQPAGNTYLWSTGSKETSISVVDTGVYWLKVVDKNGCYTIDTAVVSIASSSPSGHLLNVTQDQTIPYGGSVQLNADGDVIYLWKPDNGSLSNPNINNPVATPLNTTVYTVFGFGYHGCMDSASVTISVDSVMNECIPSAFTPNGDGRNDIFRPACITFQQLVDFRIYDRWGQQVFYSNSYQHGWDGTFHGVPQDMGTYYYYIVVARPGAADVIYKGDVTLIR